MKKRLGIVDPYTETAIQKLGFLASRLNRCSISVCWCLFLGVQADLTYMYNGKNVETAVVANAMKYTTFVGMNLLHSSSCE